MIVFLLKVINETIDTMILEARLMPSAERFLVFSMANFLIPK